MSQQRQVTLAQDTFVNAQKAEDAVKFNHPMNKLIDDIFGAKKKNGPRY